jgi:transcriptional regulator with XRE-family HTH domain
MRQSRGRPPKIPKITVAPEAPHPWAHLKAWRERAGLTQQRVAEIFSITDVTAHRWETGKAPMTVANLFRLAEMYGAASIQDLTMAPQNAELHEDRRKALKLVSMLSEARRKQWLDLGQTLAD